MHMHVQVANASTTHLGHAEASYSHDITTLCALRDLQWLGTIQGWHLNRGSQRRLAKRDWYFAVEFATLTRKKWMVFNFDDTVAISWRATVAPGIAFAGQPHSHIPIHARWNRDMPLDSFLGEASAGTRRTFLTNHAARSLAGWTGGLESKNARRLNHLAAAAAILAGHGLGTGFSTAAVAVTARLVPVEHNRCAGTTGSLQKREGNRAENIAPLTGTVASSFAATPETAAPEHIPEGFKNIRQIVELVLLLALEPGVPIAVVPGAKIAVGKHLEGTSRLFKLISSLIVARVFIRMAFDCQLAVSIGNLRTTCPPFDAQNLVIIALLGHERG